MMDTVHTHQSQGFSLTGICCPCASGWGGLLGLFAAAVAVAAVGPQLLQVLQTMVWGG